jgi:hypothetical protein
LRLPITDFVRQETERRLEILCPRKKFPNTQEFILAYYDMMRNFYQKDVGRFELWNLEYLNWELEFEKLARLKRSKKYLLTRILG